MSDQVMSLIILIGGLLLCFFGFKIQKMLIMVAWFIIGYNLVGYGNNLFHIISDNNILIIASIAVGLLLGGVGFKLEKAAIFIAVTFFSYKYLSPYIPISDARIAIMVRGTAALLAGALSTLFIKPALIIVTSLIGGALVKQCLPVFITIPSNILLICVIVVIIAGIATQFKTS